MSSRSVAALIFAALLLAPGFPRTAAAQTVQTYSTAALSPRDIAWDAAGTMYASGSSGATTVIWKVAAGGGSATMLATGFTQPWGLTIGPDGALYVADRGSLSTAGSARVWRVASDGSKTIYASGFTDAMFVHFDASGRLFVSEWGPRNLKVVSTSQVVSNYALALGAPGEQVGDFELMPSGQIYVNVGPSLMLVGPGGSPVSTIATGLVGTMGMRRNGDGSFFVSRYSARDLWLITPGGAASKWVGTGNTCTDGAFATASFNLTAGLRVRDDILYIADQGCNRIRTIDLRGQPTTAARQSWGQVKTRYR